MIHRDLALHMGHSASRNRQQLGTLMVVFRLGGLQSATIAGDPVTGVREGQFYGMSGPKASKALLRLVGRDRPLKTQEIFDAIRKGGVTQIQNANTLYRSLTRDPELHNVGRGRWGLTEWYPNARRKAGAAPDDGAGPESQSAAEQDSPGEQQVSSVDQEQMPTG
jgi:hypothetical protein